MTSESRHPDGREPDDAAPDGPVHGAPIAYPPPNTDVPPDAGGAAPPAPSAYPPPPAAYSVPPAPPSMPRSVPQPMTQSGGGFGGPGSSYGGSHGEGAAPAVPQPRPSYEPPAGYARASITPQSAAGGDVPAVPQIRPIPDLGGSPFPGFTPASSPAAQVPDPRSGEAHRGGDQPADQRGDRAPADWAPADWAAQRRQPASQVSPAGDPPTPGDAAYGRAAGAPEGGGWASAPAVPINPPSGPTPGVPPGWPDSDRTVSGGPAPAWPPPMAGTGSGAAGPAGWPPATPTHRPADPIAWPPAIDASQPPGGAFGSPAYGGGSTGGPGPTPFSPAAGAPPSGGTVYRPTTGAPAYGPTSGGTPAAGGPPISGGPSDDPGYDPGSSAPSSGGAGYGPSPVGTATGRAVTASASVPAASRITPPPEQPVHPAGSAPAEPRVYGRPAGAPGASPVNGAVPGIYGAPPPAPPQPPPAPPQPPAIPQQPPAAPRSPAAPPGYTQVQVGVRPDGGQPGTTYGSARPDAPPPDGADQDRFAAFAAGAPPATGEQRKPADPPAPPAKTVRLPLAIIGIVGAAALLLVIAFGITWVATRPGTPAFDVGSCVRESGAQAVAAECAEAGAFTVVQKVDRIDQCADPGQPHVVVPGSNGREQVLCLRPAGK